MTRHGPKHDFPKKIGASESGRTLSLNTGHFQRNRQESAESGKSIQKGSSCNRHVNRYVYVFLYQCAEVPPNC
jgi:hypothetical protein